MRGLQLLEGWYLRCEGGQEQSFNLLLHSWIQGMPLLRQFCLHIMTKSTVSIQNQGVKDEIAFQASHKMPLAVLVDVFYAVCDLMCVRTAPTAAPILKMPPSTDPSVMHCVSPSQLHLDEAECTCARSLRLCSPDRRTLMADPGASSAFLSMRPPICRVCSGFPSLATSVARLSK